MKYIITLFLLISVAYGQTKHYVTKPNLSHANTSGWIPTGNLKIVKATIYKNSRDTISGFIRLKELHRVADMKTVQKDTVVNGAHKKVNAKWGGFYGADAPSQNIYDKEGALYDSKMKPFKMIAGGHVDYIDPITHKLMH